MRFFYKGYDSIFAGSLDKTPEQKRLRKVSITQIGTHTAALSERHQYHEGLQLNFRADSFNEVLFSISETFSCSYRYVCRYLQGCRQL
jgi:hypothetical protein